MILPRGIRRRIFAAFAVLISILALTSAAGLRSHDRVHGLLEEVAHAEQAVEAALRLSAAVRDQYAHQAHTVILNDLSHLGFYEQAEREVARTMAAAREILEGEGDQETLAVIEALAKDLDVTFRQFILPRIPGEPATIAPHHDRALELVEEVVERVDQLTERIGSRVQHARRQADRAEQQGKAQTGLFFLAGLGFAVGTGFFLDRSITEPLRALEGGTMRLAKGDLSARIEVRRDDELGSLSRHFNEMAAELAEHQRRLVQSEKLAGLGTLAAGVAHEINNPLAVILGYARLLSREGGERVAADAKVIAEEVERCQAIVSGLLELSRIPRLELEPLELEALVREVGERLPAPGEPPLDLQIEGQARVEGDDIRLRQIFANLLRNARDAAPDRPILVTLRDRGDRIAATVRDQGPGLGEEAQARLFEPFFTTKASGTGLGLAVSASLARAHGGELLLAETGPEGTTFEILLPKRSEKEVA